MNGDVWVPSYTETRRQGAICYVMEGIRVTSADTKWWGWAVKFVKIWLEGPWLVKKIFNSREVIWKSKEILGRSLKVKRPLGLWSHCCCQRERMEDFNLRLIKDSGKGLKRKTELEFWAASRARVSARSFPCSPAWPLTHRKRIIFSVDCNCKRMVCNQWFQVISGFGVL